MSEPGEDGHGGIMVKTVRVIDVRNMFTGFTKRRDFHVSIKPENLAH